MNNSFFRLPENMSSQARSSFLIATLLTVVHFAAVPYYLYLGRTFGIAQYNMLAFITIALGVIFGIGAMLSRRGQPTAGMMLVLGVLAISYPPVSATLVGGLGLVLGLALIVVGPMSSFQILPRKSAWIMTVLTIASGLATFLLDVFGSTTRPSLSGIVIQLLAVAVVAFLGLFIFRQIGRNRIQARLTALILIVTIPVLIGTTVFISSRAAAEMETRADHDLEENNHGLETNLSTWLELHARTLQEMAMLPDIASMDADSQRPTLLAIAATHPNLFLVQTTDLTGMNIARNDDSELKNYHDRGWFLGAQSGAPVTFEALISRTTGKPALNMSAPIRDEFGKIVGVASLVSELDEISHEVLDDNVAGHNISFIVDASNRVVAHPDPTYTEDELRDLSAYPPVAALREGQTGSITFTDENGELWHAYVSTLDNGWGIITQQRETEHVAFTRQFQRTALLLIVIGSAVLLAAAWYTIRRTLQPIGTLTDTASAIAAGDLNRVAKVESQDEIGVLSKTFNTMTAQLKSTLDGLEQRVAERTRNLELAAEVGRTVSQVRALDIMLRDAAELIRKQFDLYYVQVYLTDPSQTNLMLQSGTGAVGTELVGRRHRLPLNTASINGRAAAEKKSVVISDTTASATFKPNPLLPNTRSELAVPLLIGDRVVGVLDMQSERPGSLNQDVLSAFEALAGQLAIAIQNANLLAETNQARAEVEAQARRLVRTGWNEHLDAIHKPEQIGFVFDQKTVTPLAEMDETPVYENGKSVSVPITMTGEPLGSIVIEMEDDARKEQVSELVNVVARQLAQQIENLRLLESAERYRHEAEEASRRLTREGWKSYAEEAGETLSYVYDLKEVRPQNNNGDREAEATGYVLPLKVRDETIGKLVVQGMEAGDGESLSLAAAVAERLGAHIESLRQFEETQRGQMELDKRARQLAAVANVSSVSSRELDIQKMLESVVYLTQRQFGLYHAHVFTYNNQTEMLRIAACGWKEGDEHEGTHGTATIPLAQEKSLVARAARTRQAVIVNDVRNEPGWLPNPLLPDSNSELAVPLIIGDEILGVLDVQSDSLNAFSEEDANIYTTLASQISTSLQNAQSFVQARKQAERESTLNIISQKIQSATTVEAVLQIAARELGHTLGASLTIAQLGLKES